MKKVNMTFSIPQETAHLMQGLVARRKMSSFVALAIQRALENRIKALEQEYAQANVDPDRIEVIKDWASLEGEPWDD